MKPLPFILLLLLPACSGYGQMVGVKDAKTLIIGTWKCVKKVEDKNGNRHMDDGDRYLDQSSRGLTVTYRSDGTLSLPIAGIDNINKWLLTRNNTLLKQYDPIQGPKVATFQYIEELSPQRMVLRDTSIDIVTWHIWERQ